MAKKIKIDREKVDQVLDTAKKVAETAVFIATAITTVKEMKKK